VRVVAGARSPTVQTSAEPSGESAADPIPGVTDEASTVADVITWERSSVTTTSCTGTAPVEFTVSV